LDDEAIGALLGAVRHRRQLVDQRRPLRQRLHEQLNALCPGLSAPERHGRVLQLGDPSGQAVLACAVAFRGRAPSARSLRARTPGGSQSETRASGPSAGARSCRRRRTPSCARSGCGATSSASRRSSATSPTWRPSSPRCSSQRTASCSPRCRAPPRSGPPPFACHAPPIERFATPEQLYSASGLAPASYESATIRRRGRISRQGLAERRDALMGIAWGLSQHSESFRARDRELRARGMQPIEAHVALARHACRLCFALLATQQPFDEQRYRHSRHSRAR
jgi:hypothetical protein